MKSTSVRELAALDSPQLIDVREPFEFAPSHAVGAVNVPLAEIPAVAGLRADQPVYVICQSGGRSARAVEILQARGFDAVNVEGCTSAWLQAGLPAEPAR